MAQYSAVSPWQYNTPHHVLATVANFTVVWFTALFIRNMTPRHWVIDSWRFESTSKRQESITKRRGVISQKKGAVNCTCKKLGNATFTVLHFKYSAFIHYRIHNSAQTSLAACHWKTYRMSFLNFTIPSNCSLQRIRVSKNSLFEGQLRAQLT
jgi:hypothetical protein